MRLLLKLVLVLAILAVLVLVGVALFSDLPAPSEEISVPVEVQ